MKAKNCLIFGGSGQIGRNLIRKLTKNNYQVTVVTRNIHQKSYIIKTQANPGYINIVEANIFDEKKIRKLFEDADICINLIGILYEKKNQKFENLHSHIPKTIAKVSKKVGVKNFLHLSSLGIDKNSFSKYALSSSESSTSLKYPANTDCGLIKVDDSP